MTDRNTVLKFAHLSRGRIRDPRILKIIEDDRRALDARVAEWQAEQERKNAALAARMAAFSGRYLMLAPRYVNGVVRNSHA